jgi:hypothetical protein
MNRRICALLRRSQFSRARSETKRRCRHWHRQTVNGKVEDSSYIQIVRRQRRYNRSTSSFCVCFFTLYRDLRGDSGSHSHVMYISTYTISTHTIWDRLEGHPVDPVVHVSAKQIPATVTGKSAHSVLSDKNLSWCVKARRFVRFIRCLKMLPTSLTVVLLFDPLRSFMIGILDNIMEVGYHWGY